MPGKFDGKTVIVTGGGSGIGAATAQRFAREGASVVVADISGRRSEAVAAEIEKNRGHAIHFKMDAADPEAVRATIDLAVRKFGQLDVMFNNAGFAELAPLEEISLESWNRVLSVTLTSVFLGMKFCIPLMRQRGGGAIINTASVSGLGGDIGMSSYNAAKAGVINLTRSAALENAKHNIRINCVCPGAINTRAVMMLGANNEDAFRSLHGQAHPVGRIGEPDEIASVVLFLASDDASFVTGAAIAADGGLSAQSGAVNMLQILRPGTW